MPTLNDLVLRQQRRGQERQEQHEAAFTPRGHCRHGTILPPRKVRLCETVLCSLVLLLAFLTSPLLAAGQGRQVGILHSLSGTMAISETSLRDVV